MHREDAMRHAINVPNFDVYADPRLVADLARAAVGAGWDGFFVWDHILVDRDWRVDIADPWILLSAIASATERIRLGPMVTPLPRRHPWVLARQAVTLDRLSDGRLTLGVGLGFPPEAEFEAFGDDPDIHVRAAKLDEGLAILAGLWSGEPFAFEGRHHRLQEMTFLPRPVQSPRIPIWVAAVWPNRRPLERAARWDGVAPIRMSNDPDDAWLKPAEVAEIRALVDAARPAGAPAGDIMVMGETPGDDPDRARAIVEPYTLAGATWWSEGVNPMRGSLDAMRERIAAGPLGRQA
jgi:alkanesulfonate monooxygenase SsuD/methylene tetrahydromethanopterin reductase-like flavin-dependent oxidoreductase (luciferase family)